MKKLLTIMLTVLMAVVLFACSGSPAATDAPTEPQEAEKPAATEAPTEEPKKEAYEITYQNARAYTNSIGTVWVQSIVEITNTGSVPLYLGSGAYDLEDANGKLVASRTMVSSFPDVIDVGEKGYMYEETTLDEAPQGDLTILPRPDVEAAKVDLVRFFVTDDEIKDGDYGVGLKLMGRIENTSDETQSMVYIACVLYGADGAPIGLMFNILTEELAAGDKIGFECSGMSLPEDVTLDSVAAHTVYSYPMQMQF